MAHKWSNPSSQGLDNRRAGSRGKVRHVTITPELRAQYETSLATASHKTGAR